MSEMIQEIAAQLRASEDVPQQSVRTILQWFGAKRRGFYIVRKIRQALEDEGVITVPDFETAYIDSSVQFVLSSSVNASSIPFEDTLEAQVSTSLAIEAVLIVESPPLLVSGAISDPTFRIGQLTAANKVPISVKPDASVSEATTLMMMNDFSQLPVMQNERDVKGVISWKSIGRASSLGRACDIARECMEAAPEANADQSLFLAIPLIVECGYVLVRQRDKRVSGIVTTTDLSLQFRQLAEPFLLVGEIENYIRRLIDNKFTKPQLIAVRDSSDPREINNVADLTFGEYVRLLQNVDNWAVIGVPIERSVFVKRLNQVRELRNDVMHFDPDPFDPEDLELLRSFVSFLRDLLPARTA